MQPSNLPSIFVITCPSLYTPILTTANTYNMPTFTSAICKEISPQMNLVSQGTTAPVMMVRQASDGPSMNKALKKKFEMISSLKNNFIHQLPAAGYQWTGPVRATPVLQKQRLLFSKGGIHGNSSDAITNDDDGPPVSLRSKVIAKSIVLIKNFIYRFLKSSLLLPACQFHSA